MTRENSDRPSAHGAILGEALADLAKAGSVGVPNPPEMCATCAFREGCMTNQMAGTGKDALNCVLGIDPNDFACHHGMKDGKPTKLCAGYVMALLAPPAVVQAALLTVKSRLESLSGPDAIREAFDRWWPTVDPNGEMDNYQLSRAYERARGQQ